MSEMIHQKENIAKYCKLLAINMNEMIHQEENIKNIGH